MSAMSFYTEIQELWSQKHDDLAASWIKKALAAEERIEKAGNRFYEPSPLRFYVSLSGVGNTVTPVFSVRYAGQQVAKVVVDPEPVLEVDEDQRERNERCFGVSIPKGEHPWTGEIAREFRRQFKRLPAPAVRECTMESRILQAMEGRSRKTAFRDMRHVGFTRFEYPFQVPVPLSAHEGMPQDSPGHMDIVARLSHPSRLAIWELKKPGELAQVVQQVYIYGTVTALVLRSSSGPKWWRLFGFGDETVPEKLTIECAAVVTKDQREGVVAQARKLLADNPLEQEQGVKLALYAAIYDPETLAIQYEALG